MNSRLRSWFERIRHENIPDLDLEEARMFFEVDQEISEDDSGPVHGGSRPGRSANVDRDHDGGHRRIFEDYFADRPVYNDITFRRRFRMRRALFLRIVDGVTAEDKYFEQKVDALGKLGFSTLQKVVAAIRILAYGCSYDAVDEYVRMSESSASDCLHHFCCAVISFFGPEYLRSPTISDMKRLMQENAKRGFPGMIGSIDCYNWKWDNCPKAWNGSYRGVKGTSIVLEAAVSHDLWIWHAFFGMPGAMNDINVLQRSDLLHSLIKGTMPAVQYSINGHDYTLPYWLADGIYPNWPVFVKTIPDPQGAARKHFSMMQESCRKDVERAFGVLQSRFAIVKNPARSWTREKLKEIMITCVILNNMIVENERDNEELAGDLSYIQSNSDRRRHCILQRRPNLPDHQFTFIHSQAEDLPECSLAKTMHAVHQIRDHSQYFQRQSDLVEHMWNQVGNL